MAAGIRIRKPEARKINALPEHPLPQAVMRQIIMAADRIIPEHPDMVSKSLIEQEARKRGIKPELIIAELKKRKSYYRVYH